jgi:hypothetical protein
VIIAESTNFINNFVIFDHRLVKFGGQPWVAVPYLPNWNWAIIEDITNFLNNFVVVDRKLIKLGM